MNFDNYFDDRFVENTEEDRLVDDLSRGFSYKTTLNLVETLSKGDQLKLALHLLEGLSKDQWVGVISYLKYHKGIKFEDQIEQEKIEQKRLEDTYSRVIVSADYRDYTPREWIVDYLNVYFDWTADELEVSPSTTVFFSDIWNDFVKHVQSKTGWKERRVVKSIRQGYFRKYLSNYGTRGNKLMHKDEDLYQDWLYKGMLLSRRKNISRKRAKELLFEQDPEGSKKANAITTRAVVEGLPALREEWQVLTPNFVYKK